MNTEAEKAAIEAFKADPSKWANQGCKDCGGRGVVGHMRGRPTVVVYCRCAKRAWGKAMRAQLQEGNEVRSEDSAALERLRDRVEARVDSLLDRAAEEREKVAAARIAADEVEAITPELEEIGKSERALTDRNEALAAKIFEVERLIGWKRTSSAEKQREIDRLRELQRQLEVEIQIMEAERETMQTAERKVLDAEAAALAQRRTEAEDRQAREARRRRRKIREHEDRYDKLMDRVSRLRSEAGIEVGAEE